MNPWYVNFIYLILFALLLVLVLVGIVWLVVACERKKRVRKPIAVMVMSSILLLGLILFVASHSTYYKYNDWKMLISNINMIEEEYGPFNEGTPEKGKAGRIGYYIYTDNGPIMPDHLDHYYYLEYDEWGMVYNVYDGCQIGG